MSVHFNGKKDRELYFNGKKISEAYYGSTLVYKKPDDVQRIWMFINGNTRYAITGDYSTDGIVVDTHAGSAYGGLYVSDITSISGTLGQSGSVINGNLGYVKDITSGNRTFHLYKYTNILDYFYLVLPNSIVGGAMLRCSIYEPKSTYAPKITAITDTTITIYDAVYSGTFTGYTDLSFNYIWTTEGVIQQ